MSRTGVSSPSSSSHVPTAGRRPSPLSPPQSPRFRQQQQQQQQQQPGDRASPSTATVTADNSTPLLMSLSPQNQNYASSFSTTSQTSPAQTSSFPSSSNGNGNANGNGVNGHKNPSSSASLSSPPSSFAMSTQTSQQPNSATTNSFPTPASSVSGQFLNAGLEDGDGVMKGGGVGIEFSKQKSEQSLDMMDLDVSMQNDGTNKHDSDVQARLHNAMDVDVVPKENAFTSEPSLASLQKDMGQAFHVCKTSYTPSGPDPRLDLVSLYGLGPVAASVARTDPITGEKINRLRKSYEGKLKAFGLAGRNKPVKSDPNVRGGLRELTMWPEEEWYNQKVYGKEIKVPESDSSLHKMQMRAMRFDPGPVPNNEYWEDVLGYEKQPKNASPVIEPSRKPSISTPMFRQPSQLNGTPRASTPRPSAGRPQRAGKKRSYTDDSFVGYGDGFPDDEDMEGSLYSNSDAGSSKKRRKKDHVSGVPSSVRGGSYGVGMFVGR